MGNVCFKCFAYLNSEETRVFEPGKANFTENQRGSKVEVLSVRSHAASINNGTLPRGDSSKQPPQLQQGNITESNRIDAIRIIGPSGEGEESFCITSAGASKSASGWIPEIKIQSEMSESSESKHTQKGTDGAGATEILKGEEECSNDRKKESIIGKDDSEEIACAASAEMQDRSFNKDTMNYFDQLAVLVTKLALQEVPRYYHKNKQEADNVKYVEGLDSKRKSAYNQFRLPSHSKIHDYINGITRSIMQMSKYEVAKIKRGKQGSRKSEILAAETDVAAEFVERHKTSLGASNLNHVYKADSGTRAQNGNVMIYAETVSCGVIASSQYSRSVNMTAARRSGQVAYDGTQWPENEMIAADSQSQLLKRYDYHAKRHDYVMNESHSRPMLYNTEENKASKISSATQNSTTTAAERLAQLLVENIVKEAISEVCRTNSISFQKYNSMNLTAKAAARESMQSNDNSRCMHTWADDHMTKFSTENKFECATVEFTRSNFLVETRSEQVNLVVEKATQTREMVSYYTAFSEQLSRIILTSAVFSLKHLGLKKT